MPSMYKLIVSDQYTQKSVRKQPSKFIIHSPVGSQATLCSSSCFLCIPRLIIRFGSSVSRPFGTPIIWHSSSCLAFIHTPLVALFAILLIRPMFLTSHSTTLNIALDISAGGSLSGRESSTLASVSTENTAEGELHAYQKFSSILVVCIFF